jgi:transcriptional regulator with XRE-family HTH domain
MTVAAVAELRSEFRKELRNLYTRSGKTAEQVGRSAQVPRSAIEALLNGKAVPSRDLLVRMLQALGASEKDAQAVLRLYQRFAAASELEQGGPTPSRTPRRSYQTFVPRFGQPDPIRASDAEQLQQALRAVHTWGGKPSLRELEQRSDGFLRRSTVSDMLNGKPKVPDYDRYLAFLTACGIDMVSLDIWVYTWRRLVAMEDGDVVPWMGGMNPAAMA